MVNEKNMRKDLFRMIKNCVRLLFIHNKAFVVCSALVNIVIGVLPTVSLLLMQQIINSLQLGVSDFYSIVILIILYTVVDLLTAGISTIYGYFDAKVTALFTLDIDIMMLQKATSVDLESFENGEFHNIISRARNDGAPKIKGFFSSIMSITRQLISICAASVIISLYNPVILLIIIIVPIIKCVYVYAINKKKYTIRRKRTTRDRKAWYITHIVFLGQAVREILIFGFKHFLISKYEELSKKTICEDIGIAKSATKTLFLLTIIDDVINSCVFISVVKSSFLGLILIGNVVTYTKSIFNIKASVETLFSLLDGITRDALSVSQYFEFMEYPVESSDGYDIKEIETISIRHLYYKYNGATEYALSDINIELNTNTINLIVGLNGSGKTTLIKIILGLYTDYEGNIFVNGRDLKTISLTKYRNLTSCIFQDYMKYESSLRENVAYGNTDIIDDDTLIETVLNDSGFRKGRKVPLDSMLGTWFDDAEQLSGGEWQRVALARAMVKKAHLYAFDEPDSSLDVFIEHYFIDKYVNLMRGKIGLYSSHRFSKMCFHANNIIVLERGRIVEQGTHYELVELCGRYSELLRESKYEPTQ